MMKYRNEATFLQLIVFNIKSFLKPHQRYSSQSMHYEDTQIAFEWKWTRKVQSQMTQLSSSSNCLRWRLNLAYSISVWSEKKKQFDSHPQLLTTPVGEGIKKRKKKLSTNLLCSQGTMSLASNEWKRKKFILRCRFQMKMCAEPTSRDDTENCVTVRRRLS